MRLGEESGWNSEAKEGSAKFLSLPMQQKYKKDSQSEALSHSRARRA